MEVQVTSMEVIKITQLTLHKLERDSWVESKESRKRMQVRILTSAHLRPSQGTFLAMAKRVCFRSHQQLTIKIDGLVNSCHSRESGNPGTCKYLK